jgi:hypothetical protein
MVTAAFVAVTSGPAAAQDLEHAERLVERRAELWRVARARADSVARGRQFDTVTAGPLTAVIPRSLRVTADEAIRLVHQRLDSAMAGDVEVLAGITLVGLLPHVSNVMPQAIEPDSVVEVFSVGEEEETSPPQVADRMTSALAGGYLRRLPHTMSAWAGSAAFFPTVQPDRRDRVYQRLATQPSRVARDCFAGNVDGCATALGLQEVVDDPIMVWYDATDRRRLVEDCWACRRQPRFGDCLAGSDEACAAVLRSGFVPQPLDHNVRKSVLQVALRQGGEGAYRRLVQGGGSHVAEHLETVAGLSLDALLRTWHEEIMEARPRPPAMRRAEVWAVLAWTLVFAAMGFGSTRWR